MLQKRIAQLQRSVLPRINVEALESRTLLSAAPTTPAVTQYAEPVFQRIEIFTALPQQANVWSGGLLTGSPSPVVFVAGSNQPGPWHVDAYGHAMLTGKVFHLGHTTEAQRRRMCRSQCLPTDRQLTIRTTPMTTPATARWARSCRAQEAETPSRLCNTRLPAERAARKGARRQPVRPRRQRHRTLGARRNRSRDSNDRPSDTAG